MGAGICCFKLLKLLNGTTGAWVVMVGRLEGGTLKCGLVFSFRMEVMR